MPTDLYDDHIRLMRNRLVGRAKDAICFYGSSSFRLWDRMTEDLFDLRAVNCGFGGGTYEAARIYLQDTVLLLNPAKIVLYFGENDIANDGCTADDAFDGLIRLREDLSAHLSSCLIYVLSAKLSPARYQYRRVIRRYNDLVRKYCAESKVMSYIDGYSCLLGVNNLPAGRFFCTDLLHLSPAGYSQWAKVLKTAPGLFG